MDSNKFVIRVGTSAVPRTNSFEEMCKQMGVLQYTRVGTVLNLVEYLSNCDYSYRPDIINISSNEINSAGITIVDFCSTIRTIELLNRSRFGRTKKISLHLRTNHSLNYQTVRELEKSGLDGITATATVHGIDGVIDSCIPIEKDQFCADFLIDQTPNTVCMNLITPRQQQVLNLIAHRGLSNKQIAKCLNISESAVKLHVGILLKKFGLKNRLELALVCNAYTEV